MSPDAHPAQPPGGMSGPPGWLPRLVSDQRVVFLIVGAINSVVGYAAFFAFLMLLGKHWGPPWGYLATLTCSHVVSVLIAFVLYRYAVFRVRGHVLADLWRFETVYLGALAVNFMLLPLLVEVANIPVLLAQGLIMFVTAILSWLGHKNYSFRRGASSTDAQR
jgi:putative flippase GtrA